MGSEAPGFGVTSDAASGHWIVGDPGFVQETTIWRVVLDLAEPALAVCYATLSADERVRADRFLRRNDRDRFVASHAALRYVLARALDIAPGEVSIDVEQAGKPKLAGPRGEGLQFNLSHSGSWALIGLSELPIGVDVEEVRPIEALDLARRYFAPREFSDLARVPASEQLPAFYACWTRKEAVVKAIGLGLSFGLDEFVVTVPPEPAALVMFVREDMDASRWTLRHLDTDIGYVGAAAIAGPDQASTLRALPPDWASKLL